MKLKQEFSRLLPYYSQKDNNDKSIKCEEIAEKFAIGFAQWMVSGVEFMDDTERGRAYFFKGKMYLTKELLEIYKKQKFL